MSKERELLKRWFNDIGTIQADIKLLRDTQALLAQPEQEPVTDKPTETAMAIMPNGVCVSNVYDAYEEGRKSVMSEQKPVAWCQLVDGKVQDLLTSFEMKDWINDDTWTPLYLAPPKRKPLNIMVVLKLMNKYKESRIDLIKAVEKHHGIGE